MKFTRFLLAIVLILAVCQPPSAAAAEVADGDRVVIWLPGKGMALSSNRSGNYNAAAAVSLEDGTLSGASDAEIWTLEQSGDGWRLLQNGQAMSLGASGSQMKLGEIHDLWQLEAGANGGFLLKNLGRGRYLSYSSTRKYWTTANSGTEISLYILPREDTDPPGGQLSANGCRLYFGQLHSHTDLSDGIGTVEEAFSYASKVPGLDFFAVTDHSQNFDNAQNASLTLDATQISQDWARGKAAAEAVTDQNFVGIFGFEMTWNQGQGHMSTFGTPGFLSRDQEPYQSYAGGMEAYYAALLEAEGSVSQFNHPGEGDFKDFAGYSAALDRRITLMEVGGSLDAYDRALEKGWHLAPTNNQNNHAGQWGDASDVRTVVLAPTLSEQALYDAMANYRVYATEDRDLEIVYTLNGHLMGDQIPLKEIGETVTLSAELLDPTDTAPGTVAVVTEEGQVLAEKAVDTAHGTVEFTLPAAQDYYYLRITQADGDVAVTAPVWLDARRDLGIACIKTASEVTTAGEEQTFVLELYNDEDAALELTSVTFTPEGGVPVEAGPVTVKPDGRITLEFGHTFPVDGVYTVSAKAAGSFDGEPREFSEEIQVTVMPAPLVDDAIIDGTHGTQSSFANALALAKTRDVDMTLETGEITEAKLKTCRVLIVPGPEVDFEAEFMELIQDYVNRGGNLVICGVSVEQNPETAGRINGLLEKLGVSLRASSDTAADTVHNSGGADVLKTGNFGTSVWLEGIVDGQYYEQTAGCSVTGGNWLVKSRDGKQVLLAAEETEAGGSVLLSGGPFLADSHMEASPDANALPTANQTILENLLGITHTPQQIIALSDLRTGEMGRVYLAEGQVTAGTANPNTTFENTIYIQDATGAIAAAPYSTHGLALGTRVRILGELGTESGNPVLNILRLEILEKSQVIDPAEVGNALRYSDQGGQLVKIQGSVVSAEKTAEGEGVSRFSLEDAAGNRAVVLVEDNIRSSSLGKNDLARWVKPGNQVSAVGLVHLADGETVLRLRDCDEVDLLWSPDWEQEATDPEGGHPTTDPTDSAPEDTDTTENPDDEDETEETTRPEEENDPEDGDSPETPDPGPNPGTGDRSGIDCYLLLAALSLLGMVVLQWDKGRMQPQ